MSAKSEVLQGTLDLMVLKTIETLGELHGYGIARRIEQVAQGSISLNQGTIYPALVRLEQRGWVSSRWGLSETGGKPGYKPLTDSGREHVRAEADTWRRTVKLMARFVES